MKIMNKLKNTNGSAILIVLALMLMVASVAIVTLNNATTDMELSYNQLHEDQAFYVAEAGAKQALFALNEDDDWRGGYSGVTFGEGFYSVALRDSLDDTLLFDTVLILSTGEVQGSRTTIELTTIPEYLHPFEYAMFADAGIALDQTTCTDSYDSDSGSYALTQLDSAGNIGSNGTVTSSKDVSFGGDIQVATPGGITLGSGNIVSGDTTSTADSVNLDLIPQSEFDWARDNSIASTGMTGTNATYNNGNRSLTLGSYGEVVLTSGVYYFSDVTLGQDSKISLAPGAQVTIYMTGDLHLMQNSTVNDAGQPSNLIIYSSGANLQFDQGNTFYGAFYGPDAHIQYDQTTQVYGSLVGNSIKLDKGACFHYDRSLANVKKGTTGTMYKIAWGEVY
jgi:hypothetical protein